MFALTCPHCKHEVQTRFARPGATVKCIKCQKTFLLDARNTREVLAAPKVSLMAANGDTQSLVSPVFGEGADASASGSNQSSSKLAMAAMREMTEEMGELAPELDPYAASPSLASDANRQIKLILAVAVLVVVVVGALWFIASTPAIRDLFGSKPATKQTAPAKPAQAPAHRNPDGTLPAQDF